MHYVYVLKNKKQKKIYYGYTKDVDRRSREHGIDWRLIYFEAYLSEEDARKREKILKQYGQSRTYLKRRIAKSLDA